MSPIIGITASSISRSYASAFDSIATASGTGSSGTITFSNIPSNYKHLQIRFICQRATSTAGLTIQFNSDTGSNYASHSLSINNTTTAIVNNNASAATSMANLAYGTSTTSSTAVGVIDIEDYSSTTKAKTVRSLNGWNLNGTGQLFLASGLWTTTDAVSTITITSSTNFNTATEFALYGIRG